MSESVSPARVSAWPYRLAVTLALVTFPLIWVGGLVTTYDAGMAVPDWPGTYGYNLLLYPWQSWIAAPWDLFIEHGHRLLGALAGLVCLALVAATFRATQNRRWRIAALLALGLVVAQGMLGGARVLLDERLVALVHGCLGPFFFAYLGVAIVTLGRTNSDPAADSNRSSEPWGTHLWTIAALAYLQVVLGAMVRHIPLTASAQWFRAALVLHLVTAAWLSAQILWLMVRAVRGDRLRGTAALLLALVLVQVALGAGTYVVKFAWPAWLGDWPYAAGFVVEEKSLAQALVTTAHVANGSLILFASALAAARLRNPFFLERPAEIIWRLRLTEGVAL